MHSILGNRSLSVLDRGRLLILSLISLNVEAVAAEEMVPSLSEVHKAVSTLLKGLKGVIPVAAEGCKSY